MKLDPQIVSEIKTSISSDNLSNPFPSARKHNPDNIAKALPVARLTGIDAILAAKELPQLQSEMDDVNWDEIVSKSPKTAKWISDNQVNAAISHDDTDNLSKIERSWGEVGSDAVLSLTKGAQKMTSMAMFVGSVTPGAQLAEKMSKLFGQESPYKIGQEYLSKFGQVVEESKSLKLQEQNTTVNNADGIGGTAKALLKNPLSVADLLLEQIR